MSQECDCCGCEDPVGGIREYPRCAGSGSAAMLCEVCAGTYCSHALWYPDLVDVKLYKSLALLGNILRKDIAKMRPDELSSYGL